MGDLILVDSQVLRRSKEEDQPRKCSSRWLGPFAVGLHVNELAYIFDLSVVRICHHITNLGVFQFRDSASFPRAVGATRVMRNSTDHFTEGLEVSNVMMVRCRSRTGRGFGIKWFAERPTEWIAEDQLCELSHKSSPHLC